VLSWGRREFGQLPAQLGALQLGELARRGLAAARVLLNGSTQVRRRMPGLALGDRGGRGRKAGESEDGGDRVHAI
jgi:hypothetical protein